MNSAPAWDCHAHVIGDPARFPLWEGRGYEPVAAPLDAYLAMLDRHGLTNGVLVQPSVYRHDNSCMLDALDRAAGRLAGVAVPPPDASPRDLERMHDRGVRGVRCNVINPGGLEPRTVIGWQPVLRSLGWHVEMHIAINATLDLRELIEQFDVPVVIDHMGRPAVTDPAEPAMRDLVQLVRDGACFVKLSAPYRLSNAPAPWPDVTPLARGLLDAGPAACLWASDWPHVDCDAVIDTADLMAALADWCPSPAVRRQVLSETPNRLFSLH